MRLLQIEYFLEIAEKKSITAAAKTLFISQPALSKQMSLLEEELGIKLIVRQSRGIALTDAGKRFEQDCRRILSELKEAKNRAIAIGKEAKKDLRIGCFEGLLVDDFMGPFQTRLKELFPDIQPKLNTNQGALNRKALVENRLDVLIELEPNSQEGKGLCRRRLIKRRSVLAYSKLSPIAKIKEPDWSDFAKETYLIPDNTAKTGMGDFILGQLPKLGITEPSYELMGNFMNMFSNLKMGNGYCVLAESAMKSNPDILYRELPEFYDVGIVAVWKEENSFVGTIMEPFGTPL